MMCFGGVFEDCLVLYLSRNNGVPNFISRDHADMHAFDSYSEVLMG